MDNKKEQNKKSKRSSEFIHLQAWGDAILSFISESPYSSEMAEYIDIFNQCVEAGRIIPMRIYIGEINEIMRDCLSPKYLMDLNRILKEKFGEDLSSRMARSMAAVLKRGKIRNDDEFVRVNEWIDHLIYDRDNPDAEQQIEQYNQLLRDYEEKAARRLKRNMEKDNTL